MCASQLAPSIFSLSRSWSVLFAGDGVYRGLVKEDEGNLRELKLGVRNFLGVIKLRGLG